ncbi:expressed unknown protein [Seminavis robusta]|uniref:Uncharacterized protein n=1 Tax=Seminavis robusta TaxID=568900 RepID=A0A9N8I037_9STRA|nr:expressed unknown protein [Seminavis robusta]|eukprot:Sro3402_g347620.1 n/a (314) ;mRNA; r:5615-6556
MFDMVYPETLFTIRPSSTATKHDVTVESYPPNLVTANTSDGVHLYLQYNLNVVDQVAEGDGTGVILTLPEEQLLYVRVRTGYHAQILPGFTNLSHLQADTRATLTADCSSLTPSSSSQEDQRLRLDVTVKNDATMYLKSTDVGAELDLSGGAVMIYQGNVMGHRNVVESHARLYLQGTILPGAETQISSSAIATIDGDIRGHVTADDWAIVELVTTDNANVNQTNNSITGTIQARNAASINVGPYGNCDRVTTESNAICSIGIIGNITTHNFSEPTEWTRHGTVLCSSATTAITTTRGVLSLLLTAFAWWIGS